MPTVSVDRREENGTMDEETSANGLKPHTESVLGTNGVDRTESITQDLKQLSLTTSVDSVGSGSSVKLRSRQIMINKISANGDSTSNTRLTYSSSPIPSLSCHQDTHRFKRRSMGFSTKVSRPIPPVRSMSLPAGVPNLCLLGSFEESVLNGRLEPCGYVEGFTAELGASGSFIPNHVTLPVTTSFFNLTDSGDTYGTSPYFGHIDISNIGRRGYKVPNKGTVQLTLFNPNKTVVKMFIVHYDHSDMPPSSSTFIRQKTITQNIQKRLPPSLHYLIHLRFISTRSSRHYLHTDIKLLFARKAPDIDTGTACQPLLSTITEGPTDPKYGPVAEI